MVPFLASACLCGIICRYDGKNVPHPVLEALYKKGVAHPVCPEVLGGLPIPRIPCEIRGDSVISRNGEDLTKAFAAGAAKVLEMAQKGNLTIAVLKDKSPSCGSRFIYDGTFSERLVPGEGMAARLLRANGVTVYSEVDFSPSIRALHIGR